MRLVSIFKSPRKEEMYLYVEKKVGLKEVPEALLERFGRPVHLMDMPLKGERPLARTSVVDVLRGIDEKGFYLQMPPPVDDYMKDMRELALKAQDKKSAQFGNECD